MRPAVKVFVFIEANMKQKGFATIFGLCLILVVALIVKGIQEAEANHAREVVNFQMEQALQSSAESGIVYAAESVDWKNLDDRTTFKITKEFQHDNQRIKINVEIRGERGNIYIKKKSYKGVYLMSYASTDSPFLTKKIYRRAYAYILDDNDTTICFMELP